LHAVTTIFYIVEQTGGKASAKEAVDWLLAHFEVPSVGKANLGRARNLTIADFEDALVASVAEANRCDYFVTRNVSDFAHSPVPALSPSEFLQRLSAPS
jgi:hypothetical protein